MEISFALSPSLVYIRKPPLPLSCSILSQFCWYYFIYRTVKPSFLFMWTAQRTFLVTLVFPFRNPVIMLLCSPPRCESGQYHLYGSFHRRAYARTGLIYRKEYPRKSEVSLAKPELHGCKDTFCSGRLVGCWTNHVWGISTVVKNDLESSAKYPFCLNRY